MLDLISTWEITYHSVAAPFSLLCVGYVTVKLAKAFWFSDWLNKPITLFKRDRCWECHKVVDVQNDEYYLFEPTLEVLCKKCCDSEGINLQGEKIT